MRDEEYIFIRVFSKLVVDASAYGCAKNQNCDYFYLSPFIPPLHFMERGIGGEVF